VSYEGDYRGGYRKRRVEKQRYFDEREEVYSYPSEIEADSSVKNSVHVLVEI
jgi:hypothetical protein